MVGGECGPDSLLHADKKVPKVQPIVQWTKCAVWDFLTLIARSYGFDPQGLVDHYGPDGDLRYGCWSCPLIWNDKTGEYLSEFNPILGELVRFTDSHLRPGGSAWKAENRELFQRGDSLKDGRLSLDYCKRLFDWIIDFEQRHGQQLLEPWQKLMIQGVWAYRKAQPAIMASHGGQMTFDLEIVSSLPKSVHITHTESKIASILSQTTLVNDQYHNRIKEAARILTDQHPGVTWQYIGQSSGVLWRSVDHTPALCATYRGGRSIEIEPL